MASTDDDFFKQKAQAMLAQMEIIPAEAIKNSIISGAEAPSPTDSNTAKTIEPDAASGDAAEARPAEGSRSASSDSKK